VKEHLQEIMQRTLELAQTALKRDGYVASIAFLPVMGKLAIVPLIVPDINRALEVVGAIARKVKAEFLIVLNEGTMHKEGESNRGQNAIVIVATEFDSGRTRGSLIEYNKVENEYTFGQKIEDAEIGGGLIESALNGWKRVDTSISIGLMSEGIPDDLMNGPSMDGIDPDGIGPGFGG